MNDVEELLRDFRSALDEPPPGALERARSRAVGAAGKRAVRLRVRWLALPATAIGVTAAAVTASLMLGQTPGLVAEPTAGPAISGPTTVSPPNTAEIIEAWARDLGAGPLPPPVVPGQLILPSVRQLQDGQWTEPPAITIEREGLLVVENAEFGDRGSFQRYVAQQRAEFTTIGPSWRYPTAEWLEALEPSPANLLSQMQGPLAFTTSQILGAIDELLGKGEVILPPRVRAGLLRLFATMDGVTAYEATVDGRLVRVVGLPRTVEPRPGLRLSYETRELYIDPSANRFVGSGTLKTGRSPDLPQCVSTGNSSDATPHPRPTGDECFEVIPLDEPEREMITLWEQTLVTP